mgnify:CR=1 FL=1
MLVTVLIFCSLRSLCKLNRNASTDVGSFLGDKTHMCGCLDVGRWCTYIVPNASIYWEWKGIALVKYYEIIVSDSSHKSNLWYYFLCVNESQINSTLEILTLESEGNHYDPFGHKNATFLCPWPLSDELVCSSFLLIIAI